MFVSLGFRLTALQACIAAAFDGVSASVAFSAITIVRHKRSAE